LSFVPQSNRVNLSFLNHTKKFLSINKVFLFSLSIIIYAGFHIEFDYNLRNLDYNNRPLKIKQAIIENNMPSKSTILIEASTVDELIKKSKNLQQKISSTKSVAQIALSADEAKERLKKILNYDFYKLKTLLTQSSKEVGFKDGYFKSSYNFTKYLPKNYNYDFLTFKKLGFEILQQNDKFYTIATIDKRDKGQLNGQKGVYVIDTGEIIKETTQKMFEELLFFIFLAFSIIVGIIIFVIKQKSILALNFILFPIAIILLYLTFIEMNIMHLFSIIIVIVAGIDYGIYISKENSSKTKEAIFYSLVTTFSGFGILIFSDIGAIHSIGVVITIGILSIFLLVLTLRSN
jgi:predicted RND superfamily exporter protein